MKESFRKLSLKLNLAQPTEKELFEAAYHNFADAVEKRNDWFELARSTKPTVYSDKSYQIVPRAAAINYNSQTQSWHVVYAKRKHQVQLERSIQQKRYDYYVKETLVSHDRLALIGIEVLNMSFPDLGIRFVDEDSQDLLQIGSVFVGEMQNKFKNKRNKSSIKVFNLSTVLTEDTEQFFQESKQMRLVSHDFETTAKALDTVAGFLLE